MTALEAVQALAASIQTCERVRATGDVMGTLQAMCEHVHVVEEALEALKSPVTSDVDIAPGYALPAQIAEEMRLSTLHAVSWYHGTLGNTLRKGN